MYKQNKSQRNLFCKISTTNRAFVCAYFDYIGYGWGSTVFTVSSGRGPPRALCCINRGKAFSLNCNFINFMSHLCRRLSILFMSSSGFGLLFIYTLAVIVSLHIHPSILAYRRLDTNTTLSLVLYTEFLTNKTIGVVLNVPYLATTVFPSTYFYS